MIRRGEVTNKQLTRGGANVTIRPLYDQAVDKPYFKGSGNTPIDLVGLSDKYGKKFRAGDTVTIEIKVVEVEPVTPEVALTEGLDTLGGGDEVTGD